MTPNSADELDDLTPHQLIDEVRQIAEQYGREVTTARRTWPKSIKDRVSALVRLGVPGARIAKECGIPVATVFFWYKQIPGRKQRARTAAEPRKVPRQARFLALAGPDTCNSNPTVGVELELEAPPLQPAVIMGFQVLLPGGIEVRGLASVEQVLTLYRGCRA